MDILKHDRARRASLTFSPPAKSPKFTVGGSLLRNDQVVGLSSITETNS
jgi:hypothetical protein